MHTNTYKFLHLFLNVSKRRINRLQALNLTGSNWVIQNLMGRGCSKNYNGCVSKVFHEVDGSKLGQIMKNGAAGEGYRLNL
jgi:hypothetical protein